MMIMLMAAVAAWALGSVPVGYLVSQMCRAGREGDLRRRPISSTAETRIMSSLLG
ncbi:hypothetical protein [Naasia lichenicola]|uniref:hypothetical protein n=1 Tax=Naasia lichenicola TaxID=2565933 RepID=UPI00130E3879|nr:hypothetical protein [Naasia lichenicola]